VIFLFKEYENFCKSLSEKNIYSLSAKKVLSEKKSKFLILKHDIEADPKKALKIAQIENKYNHRASYYVHFDILIKNIDIFKQIQNLGHEVSYHYDVLDKNEGDFLKAKKVFDEHIDFFEKKGFEIKTVCQHGNPLIERVGYKSNRDFLRKFENEYSLKDIVVNFSKEVGEFTYISDVGYHWRIIPNIEVADIYPQKDILVDYNEMIKLAEEKSLIISSHPHRYFNSKFDAKIKFLVFNFLKFNAKLFYKTSIGKSFINKFYFLAKKF